MVTTKGPFSYPKEVREGAVQRYLNGESVREVGDDLHISRMTILRWVHAVNGKVRKPLNLGKEYKRVKKLAGPIFLYLEERSGSYGILMDDEVFWRHYRLALWDLDHDRIKDLISSAKSVIIDL